MMASIKKGQLSIPGEWAKHLNRAEPGFWHRERAAERQDITQRLMDDADEEDSALNGLADAVCYLA